MGHIWNIQQRDKININKPCRIETKILPEIHIPPTIHEFRAHRMILTYSVKYFIHPYRYLGEPHIFSEDSIWVKAKPHIGHTHRMLREAQLDISHRSLKMTSRSTRKPQKLNAENGNILYPVTPARVRDTEIGSREISLARENQYKEAEVHLPLLQESWLSLLSQLYIYCRCSDIGGAGSWRRSRYKNTRAAGVLKEMYFALWWRKRSYKEYSPRCRKPAFEARDVKII